MIQPLALGNDTTRVKLQVLNVFCPEERIFYNGEFNMCAKAKDTNIDIIGILKTFILKDFGEVKKKY
jgi:hypothetical protein